MCSKCVLFTQYDFFSVEPEEIEESSNAVYFSISELFK